MLLWNISKITKINRYNISVIKKWSFPILRFSNCEVFNLEIFKFGDFHKKLQIWLNFQKRGEIWRFSQYFTSIILIYSKLLSRHWNKPWMQVCPIFLFFQAPVILTVNSKKGAFPLNHLLAPPPRAEFCENFVGGQSISCDNKFQT